MNGDAAGRAAATSGVAVVTIAHQRHGHLLRQQRLLAAERASWQRVVVAMGDDEITEVLDDCAPTALVHMPIQHDRLPLAAARNLGVQTAFGAGVDAVVLLDVDCLPGPGTMARYAEALARHPDALCCGPVTYLPPLHLPTPVSAVEVARLRRLLLQHRRPHPARPDPATGTDVVVESSTKAAGIAAYSLFWSLSFGCTRATWEAFGGFDEGYAGYGAEDTDVGLRALQHGIPLVWVGGADVFHQHHPVSRPPVEHLDDILRNGAYFEQRWGFWPMAGWLAAFEELGLVHRRGTGWARS